MRWSPLATVGVLAAFASVTSAAPAPVQTKTVRGVVRDREKRPLAGVQVHCDKVRGRVETGDDGVFEFEEVPIGQFRLKAYLLGVPGEVPGPDVQRSTSTSAKSFDLTVDRGEEVVFRAAGVTYPSRGSATPRGPIAIFGGAGLRDSALWIETETRGRWARWHEIPQNGALAFRRVLPRRPWFLYVAATETTGTCFISGERLPTGEVAVELEAGLPIKGTVHPLPPITRRVSTGPAREYVVARRGPVTVWTDLSPFDGRFSTPALPAGAWRVTAVCGGLEGTIEAPAGADLDLELR
jgi:hypothetical protein